MNMDSIEAPGLFRYVLGYLLVGCAWGFTTPFIRRAALKQTSSARPVDPSKSWITNQLAGIGFTILDFIKRPSYTIPLLLNLSGSLAFFIIIGQAELSLTVPIINSLAFLFTVLGEWVAEGKAITKDTWFGIALVLTGILVCVKSKF